jgi:stearoyl-CoA desaturase (Delta-9 desaturase)
MGAVIFGCVYVLSMLSITVGYHRYFSHKAFETSRLIQFMMGFFGCCQLQGGPIAWSAIHRHHHRFSDRNEDLHSPLHGFYQAHMGWLLNPKTYEVAFKPLKDLQRYKELVWLDRYNFIPAVVGLLLLWVVGFMYQQQVPGSVIDGNYVVYWGGLLRLVVVWHATWSVNSVCHLWGTRPFNVDDTSRNNVWVAVLTMGEGWHNNHHKDPSSARAGLRWWQMDLSYYVILLLEVFGLVKNVCRPQRPTL